jgi:hypothetical protein
MADFGIRELNAELPDSYTTATLYRPSVILLSAKVLVKITKYA